MKTTFKVHATKPGPEYSTFEEAFVAFFEAVAKIVEGGTSYQALETACWIEGVFELSDWTVKAPLYFYDARDFAYGAGLLVAVEGSSMPTIANPLPKVSAVDITALFVSAGIREAEALLQTFGKCQATRR